MRYATLFIISLVILAPSACSQSPEWQPTVFIKAPFGSDDGEYFYDEVKEREDPTNQPVSCFYVCSRGIFIVDEIQHNIKIYDLSGEYKRSIPLQIKDKHRGFISPWPYVDIAVNGDRVYLLYSMVGHPYPGVTKHSIYVFRISSGEFEERILIHNDSIARNSKGQEVGNTLRLVNESDGAISVFDSIQQRSYIIVQSHKPLPSEKHNAWLPGRRFGSHRITYDRESGSVILIGETGEKIKNLFKNIPIAIGEQDHLTLAPNPDMDDSKACWAIRDSDNVLGNIVLDAGSRSGLTAIGANSPFRFGPDGNVYEVFASDDAVYVFRWSK